MPELDMVMTHMNSACSGNAVDDAAAILGVLEEWVQGFIRGYDGQRKSLGTSTDGWEAGHLLQQKRGAGGMPPLAGAREEVREANTT